MAEESFPGGFEKRHSKMPSEKIARCSAFCNHLGNGDTYFAPGVFFA
jgi:hypothetical protein